MTTTEQGLDEKKKLVYRYSDSKAKELSRKTYKHDEDFAYFEEAQPTPHPRRSLGSQAHLTKRFSLNFTQS